MSYSSPGPTYGANSPFGALNTPDSGDKGSKKRKAKTTSKVINRQLILAAVFALVIAIFAGLFFLRGQTASGTFVVRASTQIAALDPITVDKLEAVRVDPTALQADAFTGATAQEALDKAAAALASNPRAKYFIERAQQIGASTLGVASVTPLKPEEALFSLQATVANSVAGQISPGDRVDIIGTADGISGTMLSGIEVVKVTVSEDLINQAASRQVSDKTDKPEDLLPADPVPGIYLVKVPADEIVRLTAIQTNGTFTLVYRGADAKPAVPQAISPVEAICASDTVSATCLAALDEMLAVPEQ